MSLAQVWFRSKETLSYDPFSYISVDIVLNLSIGVITYYLVYLRLVSFYVKLDSVAEAVLNSAITW